MRPSVAHFHLHNELFYLSVLSGMEETVIKQFTYRGAAAFKVEER